MTEVTVQSSQQAHTHKFKVEGGAQAPPASSISLSLMKVKALWHSYPDGAYNKVFLRSGIMHLAVILASYPGHLNWGAERASYTSHTHALASAGHASLVRAPMYVQLHGW